jgi:hypothetical protein
LRPAILQISFALANLYPDGTLGRFVGSTPLHDFIYRAQAALAQAAVRIHLADIDAGRRHESGVDERIEVGEYGATDIMHGSVPI